MRPFLLILALACAACGTQDPCAGDPTQCRDAGEDSGSSTDLGTCEGVCLPPAPSEWYATVLLWVGDKPDAVPPPCPTVMPAAFPGYADIAPTVECPPCACSPSKADCSLPSDISAGAGACPGTGAGEPYSSPPSWDGTCDADGPIASAASLTVAPAKPAGSYCTPVLMGEASFQGSKPALQCDGLPNQPAGTCGVHDMTCAFPKSEGFLTCIIDAGELQCPDGWPVRHIVFPNHQACGCRCESPVGDSCSATVTVFADGACDAPLGSVMVSSDLPAACADVPPGSSFGSKSSTPPVYKAGTCAPTASGKGTPLTFCCQP